MNYIPNPDFNKEYTEQVKNLKHFIPHPAGAITARAGTKFITVMLAGEEIIGVQDGHLITSHRVIDCSLIPGPPEEPPRIPYGHKAVWFDWIRRAEHMRAYPFLIQDKTGTEAT